MAEGLRFEDIIRVATVTSATRSDSPREFRLIPARLRSPLVENPAKEPLFVRPRIPAAIERSQTFDARSTELDSRSERGEHPGCNHNGTPPPRGRSARNGGMPVGRASKSRPPGARTSTGPRAPGVSAQTSQRCMFRIGSHRLGGRARGDPQRGFDQDLSSGAR